MTELVYPRSMINQVEHKFPIKEQIRGHWFKGPFGHKNFYYKVQTLIKISNCCTNILGNPYYYIHSEEYLITTNKKRMKKFVFDKNKEAVWARINQNFYFKDVETRNKFFENIKTFRFSIDNPDII